MVLGTCVNESGELRHHRSSNPRPSSCPGRRQCNEYLNSIEDGDILIDLLLGSQAEIRSMEPFKSVFIILVFINTLFFTD